ncbi:MAG: hypothetical protein BMS9Abin25_0442 [Gammaproteobacteria bacterium]|nr:MAG: hypothetical protein BMS9Abin25_0442 [Gammaproteobacteria bacterium]
MIIHELIEVPIINQRLLKPFYLTALLLLRQTDCKMLIIISIKFVKFPVRHIWLASCDLCVRETM